MKFYKSIAKNLERGNIQIGKYKILPKYLERIPSSKWNLSVSNKKDILLTLLNPMGREWAEGELYCLFLMPNTSYIVEIDDYRNEAYSREKDKEVLDILESALFVLLDKKIKIKNIWKG